MQQSPKDNTKTVKDLLMAAAVNGSGDEAWHADGIQRLYFAHPTDINRAGSVEVRTGQTDSGYVRLEAYISPEMAAVLISQIVGSDAETVTKIRQMSLGDLTSAPPANDVEEPAEKPPTVVDGLIPSHSQAEIAAKDKARLAELNRLIAQQALDEANGAVPAEDEDDDLPDEEPNELNFEG